MYYTLRYVLVGRGAVVRAIVFLGCCGLFRPLYCCLGYGLGVWAAGLLLSSGVIIRAVAFGLLCREPGTVHDSYRM